MTDVMEISQADPTAPVKLVVKDNQLIMSAYELSLDETRLVMACIEKSHRNRYSLSNSPLSPSIKISLSAAEYADIYKVPMKAAYKALSLASDELYERSIDMPLTDEAGFRRVRWLQEQALYESGRVTLVFSEMVSICLKQLASTVTMYRLEQAARLKHKHTIRIFELLQSSILDSGKGIWRVSLEELKHLLVLEDKYDRWSDMKKRVIDPSINSINKDTSLEVSWRICEKDGRWVKALEFTVEETLQLSLL